MDEDYDASNSSDSNVSQGIPDPADSSDSEDVRNISVGQMREASQVRTIETVKYVTIDDEELVELVDMVNSSRVDQVHQPFLEQATHSGQEAANTTEDSIDILLDDSLDTIFHGPAEIEVIDLIDDEVMDIPDVVNGNAQPPVAPSFPSMDDTSAICPVCLDSLDNIKKNS